MALKTLSTTCLASALFAAAMVHEAKAAAADDAASAKSGRRAAQGLEQIVVTAQKRRESIQKIPLAVTALSGRALAASGVTTVSGLSATVPSLSIGQQFGQVQLGIRGISLTNLSAGAESSIALNKNDVYISRPVAAFDAFFDLDRVEVLRGPQGTLQGRNATGGAIDIYSKAPTDKWAGYGEASIGTYDDYRLEGALNVPIVKDELSFRFAFERENHAGYGSNEVTGHGIDNDDEGAFRGTLLYKPSADLTFKLISDFHREDDNSGGYHYGGNAGFTAAGAPVIPTGIVFGGALPHDARNVSNNSDPIYEELDYNETLDATYRLNDAMALRSITSYQYSHYLTISDLDATSAPLFGIRGEERSDQFSQEFQFTGHRSMDQWIAGLYFFHEREDAYLEGTPINGLVVGLPDKLYQGYYGGGPFTTTAGAAFGQYTRHLFGGLSMTLGGRYSIENKQLTNTQSFDLATPYNPAVIGPFLDSTTCSRSTATPGSCVPSKTWYSFTPRISLEYQIDPNTLVYASYNKGFKSGTFNLGASAQANPPVNPEKVTAYETGIKSEFLDHRLRINAAGFYYDYTGLQVGKVIPPAALILENAATSTIYGAEAEVRAQATEELQLGLTGSWLHARFDTFSSIDPSRPGGDGRTSEQGTPAFNLQGNTLPRSPEFTFAATTNYATDFFDGRLSLHGDVTWTDKVYFDAFNRNVNSQHSFVMLNSTANYDLPGDRWYVGLYLRNMTNVTVRTSGFVTNALTGFTIADYLAPPLTFSFKVGYRF